MTIILWYTQKGNPGATKTSSYTEWAPIEVHSSFSSFFQFQFLLDPCGSSFHGLPRDIHPTSLFLPWLLWRHWCGVFLHFSLAHVLDLVQVSSPQIQTNSKQSHPEESQATSQVVDACFSCHTFHGICWQALPLQTRKHQSQQDYHQHYQSVWLQSYRVEVQTIQVTSLLFV